VFEPAVEQPREAAHQPQGSSHTKNKAKNARREATRAIRAENRAAKKTEQIQEVRRAYSKAMKNRRLCSTSKGYIGLVPAFAAPGDLVCVFAGRIVSFVVRRVEEDKYILIGECYVYGLMNNESVNSGIATETFHII
jgi:hypothetical protein